MKKIAVAVFSLFQITTVCADIVQLQKTEVGEVYTDAMHMTLYTFDKPKILS